MTLPFSLPSERQVAFVTAICGELGLEPPGMFTKYEYWVFTKTHAPRFYRKLRAMALPRYVHSYEVGRITDNTVCSELMREPMYIEKDGL